MCLGTKTEFSFASFNGLDRRNGGTGLPTHNK